VCGVVVQLLGRWTPRSRLKIVSLQSSSLDSLTHSLSQFIPWATHKFVAYCAVRLDNHLVTPAGTHTHTHTHHKQNSTRQDENAANCIVNDRPAIMQLSVVHTASQIRRTVCSRHCHVTTSCPIRHVSSRSNGETGCKLP